MNNDIQLINGGDAGSAIACSLQGDDYGDRVAEWVALAQRGLMEKSLSRQSVLLRYRRDAKLKRGLQRLVALEGLCCPFLHFDFADGDGDLSLRITGPAEARPLIEAFLRLPLAPEAEAVTAARAR